MLPCEEHFFILMSQAVGAEPKSQNQSERWGWNVAMWINVCAFSPLLVVFEMHEDAGTMHNMFNILDGEINGIQTKNQTNK